LPYLKLFHAWGRIAIARKKSLLINLGLPIAFFLFTFYFMPLGEVFQFDPHDEGIELIKAVLHREGFALYTQIYNDQPPLFTILLSGWFRVFGQSIGAARLLTLSFSTLLVWAFCQTLRCYVGYLPAFIGTGLLIISCNFLRLSVSAMVGLPALALAMLSIYTFTLYKQNSARLTLLISATLLALSLQIKLFTGLLVPLLIFDLIQFRWLQGPQKGSRRLLGLEITTWLVTLIGVFALVGIQYNALSYEQLFHSHFDHTVTSVFDAASSYELIGSFLLQDFDYLLLAIPGIITLWQTKRWPQLLPLLWLIAALLLLWQHRPVWYHHYLLISLPLAWLATHGVMLSFEVLRQWRSPLAWRSATPMRARFAAGCVIFSLLLVPVKLGATQLENHRVLAQSPEHLELVQALRSNQPAMPWLFTDCPMYAFYAGLKVPPEIAVLSLIRIESQAITPAQLLAVFEKYRPKQTLLCKSPTLQNHINDYLGQHYTKIYENKLGIVYQLK
jgi:Dolichyl-phosphate-mannose-protein mannosyltransferase